MIQYSSILLIQFNTSFRQYSQNKLIYWMRIAPISISHNTESIFCYRHLLVKKLTIILNHSMISLIHDSLTYPWILTPISKIMNFSFSLQPEKWKCQPDKFLSPKDRNHAFWLGSFNLFTGSFLSAFIACYVFNGGTYIWSLVKWYHG